MTDEEIMIEERVAYKLAVFCRDKALNYIYINTRFDPYILFPE